MTAPKYQGIDKENIPVVQLPHEAGSVRVIAGDFNGTKGPASTFTPINEPIFGYGPFVMNGQYEIAQAMRDYNEGKMGIIKRL